MTILDYLGLCYTYAAVLFAFWFTSDSAKNLELRLLRQHPVLLLCLLKGKLDWLVILIKIMINDDYYDSNIEIII